MRVRVKTSITINASASAVFRYLADLKLHYVWNPHLEEVKPLKKLAKGTKYQSVNILLGVKVRSVNIVAKFIQNKEIEITNQTGMLDFCANYRLESAASGQTEVICTTVVDAKGRAFYFARPMMELLAQRELKMDLAALKAGVEQQLT